MCDMTVIVVTFSFKLIFGHILVIQNASKMENIFLHVKFRKNEGSVMRRDYFCCKDHALKSTHESQTSGKDIRAEKMGGKT